MKDSCCENESGRGAHSERQSQPDWKPFVLLAGIGMLLVLTFVQMAQISELQKSGAVQPAAVGSLSAPSSGGETYDQMMARMHPDQVSQASASGGGQRMVGGC